MASLLNKADNMLIPRNRFDGPYLERVSSQVKILHRPAISVGTLNFGWLNTASSSTALVQYFVDQPAYTQMASVFEEMWVISLEL